MNKETPFMAIDADTLYELPSVKAGQTISCGVCNKEHILEQSKDKDGLPGNLLYFKCEDKTFLAAVDGRFLSTMATIKLEE